MGPIGAAQLGEWFDACGPALLLYARQWLGPAAAEDVVQDVFVRLMRQRRRPASVEAWLFRSVRNAALNELRRQRRRRKQQHRLAAEGHDWFEARPDDLMDAKLVQAAVTGLPEEQREVILLRIWGGMTLQEISEVLGEPVSTLFSRYRAGLAQIRQRMGESCKTKSD
ncbi:MAG: hypothetical protein AMJ81_12010 [Phycisphaerae bacterium SM23_33]|nr:MAG: hypothetical protein AMJ81_12010 [Phycisphaerae bacterium SM23_33]